MSKQALGMWDVEVTVEYDGEFFTVVVDVLEDDITDDDAVNECALEELSYYTKDEEGEDISYGFTYRYGCSDVYEYAEWVNADSRCDAQSIAEAAYAVGISASQIDEAYAGEFGSTREFVEYLLDEMGVEIPSWLYIDYDSTFEGDLRFDFIREGDYYFRNI